MEKDFTSVDKLFSTIKVTSNANNRPVTIHGSAKELRCIGVGTDAAVFQLLSVPTHAFKLYADDKRMKIETEESVYQRLEGSRFFSKCYGSTDRYLVVDFESGITLYDCLLQGIPIPKQVMDDVEEARKFAREADLNPRDIHFKNVILQNGRAKIIDVSEYLEQGDDSRWEHLNLAYNEHYHLIKGKAIPSWILETIPKWYNQRYYNSFDDFMKGILKLKMFCK
ncbi:MULTISPECIES: serine/threonine protein kinase [Paraliobacillus]|uniref:serine/threonine protein kinase n=1 Tax=Paraliobacillus TaxID=200903 RepID=UPI000DD43F57|nr:MULTISPECIES: serine/threonine protein kinase [Paraliobacillus]